MSLWGHFGNHFGHFGLLLEPLGDHLVATWGPWAKIAGFHYRPSGNSGCHRVPPGAPNGAKIDTGGHKMAFPRVLENGRQKRCQKVRFLRHFRPQNEAPAAAGAQFSLFHKILKSCKKSSQKGTQKRQNLVNKRSRSLADAFPEGFQK